MKHTKVINDYTCTVKSVNLDIDIVVKHKDGKTYHGLIQSNEINNWQGQLYMLEKAILNLSDVSIFPLPKGLCLTFMKNFVVVLNVLESRGGKLITASFTIVFVMQNDTVKMTLISDDKRCYEKILDEEDYKNRHASGIVYSHEAILDLMLNDSSLNYPIETDVEFRGEKHYFFIKLIKVEKSEDEINAILKSNAYTVYTEKASSKTLQKRLSDLKSVLNSVKDSPYKDDLLSKQFWKKFYSVHDLPFPETLTVNSYLVDFRMQCIRDKLENLSRYYKQNNPTHITNVCCVDVLKQFPEEKVSLSTTMGDMTLTIKDIINQTDSKILGELIFYHDKIELSCKDRVIMRVAMHDQERDAFLLQTADLLLNY